MTILQRTAASLSNFSGFGQPTAELKGMSLTFARFQLGVACLVHGFSPSDKWLLAKIYAGITLVFALALRSISTALPFNQPGAWIFYAVLNLGWIGILSIVNYPAWLKTRARYVQIKADPLSRAHCRTPAQAARNERWHIEQCMGPQTAARPISISL